jgi:DNA-directed RNA polymerase specialized sigma subunit
MTEDPKRTLARVKRSANSRAIAEENFRLAIRDAVARGLSTRAIAESAGISHVRVSQIARER